MFSPIRKRCYKSKEKNCRKGHGLLTSFRDLSIMDFGLERSFNPSNHKMCEKRSNANRRCDDGSLGDYSVMSDSCDSNFSSDEDAYFWEIFTSRDLSPSKMRKNLPKMSTPSSSRKKSKKSQSVIPSYFSTSSSFSSSVNDVSNKTNKKRLSFSSKEKTDTKISKCKKILSIKSPSKKSPSKDTKISNRSVSFNLKDSHETSSSRKTKKHSFSESFTLSPPRGRSRSPIANKGRNSCKNYTPSPPRRKIQRKDTPRSAKKSILKGSNKCESEGIKSIQEYSVPTMKDSGTVVSNTIVDTITTAKIHAAKSSAIFQENTNNITIIKQSVFKKSLTEPKLKRKIVSPEKQCETTAKKQCHGIGKLLSRSSISFETKSLEKKDSKKSAEEKKCMSCETNETSVWRDTVDGIPLCNECGLLWRINRIRCRACWYIPKHSHNSHYHCFKCGAFNESKQAYPRLRKYASCFC